VGSVYIALLHHPVVTRTGEVVTSSVTSLDLHDLARAGRTYGVAGTFVVHPSPPQRLFVRRVLEHFLRGPGRDMNPQRGETLEQVHVVQDLDAALEAVEAREGLRPLLVATSARPAAGAVGYSALRRRLEEEKKAPALIAFGTSWGLAPEVFARSDLRLAPLRGMRDAGFNHLSVRSAAAVVLDRLFGEREP